MAARPTWKGLLRVSLIQIPIKVFPATDSASALSFHQLHNRCHTRIQQRRWCQTCQIEVAFENIVKGFEVERGRYVTVTAEELEAIQPRSTRIIDIAQFAAAAALDRVALDRAYHVIADGPLAEEALATLHAAMRGKVGIGKVALYGREYLVALEQRGDGVILHTLHHAAEIRAVEAPSAAAPIAAQVRLARRLIRSLERELNLAEFADAYQEALQQLVARKVAGEEIVLAPGELEPTPIASLREALTKSLAIAGKKKRRAA